MSLFYTSVLDDILSQLRELNSSLPETLLTSDIHLTLIKPIEGHISGKNTRAVVASLNDTRIKGFKPIYYNRIDIAAVMMNIEGAFVKGSATSLHELLPAINARYGLGLTADDVIDVPLQREELVAAIPLQIKTKSLAWYGSSTILVDSTENVENNTPTSPENIHFDSIAVGESLVITEAMFLFGIVDPDGDTLTVSDVTVTSGGITIEGSGPWTVRGNVVGGAIISYTVSDGHGGNINIDATIDITEEEIVDGGGLSGGNAALSWHTDSLTNGHVLVVETDGTYDFGNGPHEVGTLGFGEGWLYDQPNFTVTPPKGYIDEFWVEEGGVRRIEEIDGVRVLASRLRDENGWAGYKGAGQIFDYELNPPLDANEKLAVFRMLRIDYPGEPLAWQVKTTRFLSGGPKLLSMFGTEPPNPENTANEFYFHGSRTKTNTMLTWDAEGVVQNYPAVAPHMNYGWCALSIMIDTGTPDTVDGKVITRMNRFGGGRYLESAESPAKFIDSRSEMRVSWVAFQDYIDGSNYSEEAIAAGAYEPSNNDLYTTDIMVQRGSFAHVVLADGPTPMTAEHQLPLKPLEWTNNKIRLQQWHSMATFNVQYLFIYNDEGEHVATTHLGGVYVPPAWDVRNDTKGLNRSAASNATALRIVLNDFVVTSNNQRWEFVVKPDTLDRALGLLSLVGSTTHGLTFLPDGSVVLRTNGMSSLTTIRLAGEHLFTTDNQYFVTIECIDGHTIIVTVDGEEIGRHTGTGLQLTFNSLMMSGMSNGGFAGTMYNALYYEDGVLRNRFKMDEGSGLVIHDDIGGLTGTVGSGLTWIV